MPLSISNSSPLTRQIPRRHWAGLGAASLLIAFLLGAAWEWRWRGRSYHPAINDDKDVWAIQREKVEANPRATVVIGASRALFGFNHAAWEAAFKQAPIQLATVSTNPTLYLDDLANHSQFAGTLIMDVAATMWLAPAGAPITIPTENLRHYRKFTPAQRWSHYIGRILDHNLAFIEQDDLPLKQLLKRLPLPARPGVRTPPPVPPHFMESTDRRQGMMTRKTERNREFQDHIKWIWNFYFTPPPPPPGVSAEEYVRQNAAHVEKTLAKVTADIKTIQSRGGKVIMVAWPSTGNVRALEKQHAPRSLFWDRLASEAGVDHAIHWEDHPGLRGFPCPEESHLTREGAITFTRELVKVLRSQGYRP